MSRARLVIVAIPMAAGVRKMVETAKTLNPKIETLLRTHTDEEAELLRRENVGAAFMGEHELAAAITRHAMLLLEVAVDPSEHEEHIMSPD
jgi:monovalent cation:H+ antiporter-2, CPA2 family